MAHRGFSLIEITVALGIIGLMIVSTGALLQRIPVNGREVRDQDIGLRIARTKIESVRSAGYDAIPATGSWSDPLLSSLASSSAMLTVSAYASTTKKVVAQVSWRGADMASRSLSLTTLITEYASLP